MARLYITPDNKERPLNEAVLIEQILIAKEKGITSEFKKELIGTLRRVQKHVNGKKKHK